MYAFLFPAGVGGKEGAYRIPAAGGLQNIHPPLLSSEKSLLAKNWGEVGWGGGLQLGWPATEWETGPESKMAGGHFSGGGSEMAEKWPGKWLDSQNLADFGCSAICPAISETPEKWPPAISPAIFGSGTCHTKNPTVIVIHYGGGKTLRR